MDLSTIQECKRYMTHTFAGSSEPTSCTTTGDGSVHQPTQYWNFRAWSGAVKMEMEIGLLKVDILDAYQ
jgi:hypothetical protein